MNAHTLSLAIRSARHYLDWDWIRGNIRCGRHSGFPWCCTLWHTFVHTPHHYWMPYLVESQLGGPHYVRCPACIWLDIRREVKPCPTEPCTDHRHRWFIEGNEHFRQNFEVVYDADTNTHRWRHKT